MPTRQNKILQILQQVSEKDKKNKAVRKPCSVLDNHLSGLWITPKLKRFFLGWANDLYNPELNLASDMGLPSRSLPTSLVMLLPHRCTIACDIKSIGSLAQPFQCLSNHRFVRSLHSRFVRNGTILCYATCLPRSSRGNPLLHIGFAFISVALSAGSHRPEFLRMPVLGCTDFPHPQLLADAIIRLLYSIVKLFV